VFADGSPNARLLFVGEGPGADEDAQGLPFVGRAGQLLNNMISAMGLKREDVYIANVVKCRPPQNRTPEPEEANTCSPFLFRQIDVVRPEVLVALGATAATYLLGQRQPLAGLRGRVHDLPSGISIARPAAEEGSVGGPADCHAGTWPEGAGAELRARSRAGRPMPGSWADPVFRSGSFFKPFIFGTRRGACAGSRARRSGTAKEFTQPVFL
jgi:uracil-DNA glycosylase family 4